MQTKKIPIEIAQTAVEWQLKLSETEHQDVLKERIDYWCSEHPDHAHAWQRVQQMGGVFQPLLNEGGAELAQSALSQVSTSRRTLMKNLVVLVAVGGLSTWTYQRKPWQPLLADYSTAVGEQKRIQLADGSELSLNSDTLVNVEMSNGIRQIKLLQGEIHIKTATNPVLKQPLVVQTSMGRLQPLGTQFSVRSFADKVRLGVYEGQVKVTAQTSGREQTIAAGSTIYFDAHKFEAIHKTIEHEAAWTRGVIVASDMKLNDFLAELERHRKGVIQHDPSLSGLRISGTYPLNSTGKVLESLPKVLPVQVKYLSKYWVRVLPSK